MYTSEPAALKSHVTRVPGGQGCHAVVLYHRLKSLDAKGDAPRDPDDIGRADLRGPIRHYAENPLPESSFGVLRCVRKTTKTDERERDQGRSLCSQAVFTSPSQADVEIEVASMAEGFTLQGESWTEAVVL